MITMPICLKVTDYGGLPVVGVHSLLLGNDLYVIRNITKGVWLGGNRIRTDENGEFAADIQWPRMTEYERTQL